MSDMEAYQNGWNAGFNQAYADLRVGKKDRWCQFYCAGLERIRLDPKTQYMTDSEAVDTAAHIADLSIKLAEDRGMV